MDKVWVLVFDLISGPYLLPFTGVTTSLAPPAGLKWLTRWAWSPSVMVHNKLSPDLEA